MMWFALVYTITFLLSLIGFCKLTKMNMMTFSRLMVTGIKSLSASLQKVVGLLLLLLGGSSVSKLISEIHAQQTNIRRAVLPPVSFVTEVKDAWTQFDHLYEYDISVLLGVRVAVDAKEGKVGAVTKRVRRQIAEIVFGEFREDLVALERIAFEVNDSDARERLFKVIDQINKKMFVEGIDN